MDKYWSNGVVDIYCGDARSLPLENESVHCVVTSPPYWGLRDYGTNGQLGLEPTPEQYVENIVAVFREVRRVLHPTGTVWLNLGDSYAVGSNNKPHTGILKIQEHHQDNMVRNITRKIPHGLKPKDLVGIPWRVAFALQADGWYLRSDIIWAKPNPMPESVTDRPTKSHEYLFLLTKSARYYYDADAIREPLAVSTANDHRLWKDGYETGRPERGYPGENSHGSGLLQPSPDGRNKRTVWDIATEPYPGAHFAVMPQKLVEPCVLAGCPQGGTVLDLFGGSGTVGVVAQKLGRRAVLVDLSEDYCELAKRRLGAVSLPMAL